MFGGRMINLLVKKVFTNRINRKRPLRRPRTRWANFIAQGIKENTTFDVAYEK